MNESISNAYKTEIATILVRLEQQAQENNNTLSQNQISEAFSGIEMTKEQQAAVFPYLQAKDIEIIEEADVSNPDTQSEETLSGQTEAIIDFGDDEDSVSDEDLAIIEQDEEDLYDISINVSLEDSVRMYLKEIGQYPLLTPEQEINVAVRIERGEAAKDLLENEFNNIEETDTERVVTAEDLTAHEVHEDNYETLLGSTKQDLRFIVQDGIDARNKLTECNLRLVISIAKRYVGKGLTILDLIQEGNIGLMKAVEKFDYRKGFKFSTYATWWIRQATTRAIADQARTIRVPVHMVETVNRFLRTSRRLLQELGREPKPEEIAEAMDFPVEKVNEIMKIIQEPVSLDTPIGEEEDTNLGDLVHDDKAEDPGDAASYTMLQEQINEVLNGLTEREAEVLRLRFGLNGGDAMTLEEVGRLFGVTRERIRQIEAKAIKKLRMKSRIVKLQDWMK